MLLSSHAARASHWDITATDSGGSTTTFKGDSFAWQPPVGAGNNSITFGAYAGDSIDGYDDDRDTNSAVTVNAKVTLTWVADPASDPAPSYVWVVENASASAFAAGTGAVATASDGLTGDPYVNTPTYPDQDSATMSTPSGILTSPPGGGRLRKLTVSGGSVSFVHSLSASGTSTYSFTDIFPGIQNATVSDTVTIHATPYNFRRVNHYGGVPPTSSVLVGAGDLKFYYQWSSTSGSLADDDTHPDLTGIDIYENVDAPAGPTSTVNGTVYYVPDDPPFVAYILAHFESSVPASGAAIEDNHTWGTDSLANSFDKTKGTSVYPVDSYNLTQTYKFHDPATMASGAEEIIPGSAGPFTITEAVIADSNSPSGYSYQVTKDGQPSLPIPLP